MIGNRSLRPRIVAEAIGTAMLLAAVAGSGIMAERLSNGTQAIALLATLHARGGPAEMFSEFVATSGLLAVIWGCSRRQSDAIPFVVAASITAGNVATPRSEEAVR